LLEQPGKIRAYKLITEAGHGAFWGRVLYEVGRTYLEKEADTNPAILCGRGLHVATLNWVMREWQPGWRILVVEFTANDIAAIPTATDGKFRVRKLKVVGEKDLVKLGLIKKGK